MPTGYVVVLTQGASLMEYLAKCAIAEGAELMQMVPPDCLPPLEQSPVSAGLAEAMAALESAVALTEEEAERGAELEYQADLAKLEALRLERAALRLKYESALLELRCLDLPAFLEGFKQNRIAEIEQSIIRDCSDRRDRKPVRMTANQWRVDQITKAQRRLEHLQATALRYLWVDMAMSHLGIKLDEAA